MKTDLEKKSYSIVSFGYHANRIMKKWENSFPTFSSENLPYNYIILTDDADTYASVIDEKLKGYNSLFQSVYIIDFNEHADHKRHSQHWDYYNILLHRHESIDDAADKLLRFIHQHLIGLISFDTEDWEWLLKKGIFLSAVQQNNHYSFSNWSKEGDDKASLIGINHPNPFSISAIDKEELLPLVGGSLYQLQDFRYSVSQGNKSMNLLIAYSDEPSRAYDETDHHGRRSISLVNSINTHYSFRAFGKHAQWALAQMYPNEEDIMFPFEFILTDGDRKDRKTISKLCQSNHDKGITTYIVVLGNKETAGLYAEMADEVVVANHVDDAGYAIENIMKRWKKDANFLYY